MNPTENPQNRQPADAPGDPPDVPAAAEACPETPASGSPASAHAAFPACGGELPFLNMPADGTELSSAPDCGHADQIFESTDGEHEAGPSAAAFPDSASAGNAEPVPQAPARRPLSVRELVLMALCTGLVFALQVAMSGLPNIELVTLLMILYTRMFRRKTLYIIYGFVLLEGLMYGFGIWWIMYLYVWTILWAVVMILPADTHPVVMAAVAGIYGLVFGALCAIPYIFISGLATAVAWWIAGIPWDLVHCAANFAIALVLYAPLRRVTDRLMTKL